MTTKEASPVKAALSLANLKSALKVVSGAVDKSSTIPTLGCIRLEQTAAGLAIESTNLDLAIRVESAEDSGLKDPLLMPAEKLVQWTRLLSGDSVKLSATESRVTVQCGRPKAVMPVMPASNWPALSFTANNDAITLKQGALARALKYALTAAAKKEERYTLNSILIEGDGKLLRTVATDGHRMSVYAIPCDEKLKNILMPSRMVKAMIPLLTDSDEGIDLAVDEEKIVASIAGELPVHVSSRKVTGEFPRWHAVFPKNEIRISVQAPELLAALERCIVLSDEKSAAVDLIFSKGQIALTGASAENGEAEESIDAVGGEELQGEFHTRVNGEYLPDVLKGLSGEMLIKLPAQPGSALLFTAEPHEGELLDYVLMPLRV